MDRRRDLEEGDILDEWEEEPVLLDTAEPEFPHFCIGCGDEVAAPALLCWHCK
jgi:hypothetical protein